MSNSTISVIIPIFNASAYLEQCLDFLLAQTYYDLEIICINDGSTDNSLEIANRYASLDKRLRVIDKPNEGYGATCNRGLEEAKGYWISIIEPDDWVEREMYSSMIEYASTFDLEPDIVKTPYWRVINPDTPQQIKINCSYRSRVPENKIFSVADGIHLLEHHPSIWSALYRRNFLEDNNIRFLPIPGAGWADNPFLVETLCQTNRIAYLNKPFYHYREETEEKSKGFALNNTLIPIQRWNDMKDVLDRLKINDKRILRAQNRRGFTYLSGIYKYVSLENEGLVEAVRTMFDRMDPELVLTDNEIPPFDRKLFAKLMNLPDPSISKLAYFGSVFGKGAYFLANTGLNYTIHMTKNVIVREVTKNGVKR